MAVVINDFEVVPEAAPTPQSGAGSGNTEAGHGKKKEKKDFTDVLRHWHERQDRIRAH
jgi:hypothetical protein